jgi:hypothetical protein
MLMSFILSALVIIASALGLPEDSCRCKNLRVASLSEDTGSKTVEDYIYKELSGKVHALGDGAPIGGILVEVYDHPEVALDSYGKLLKGKVRKQKKLSSCRTSKEGTFCFSGIKPGKYEIRLTDDRSADRASGPWEDRSWFIILNPRHPKSTKRIVELYMDVRI